MQGEKMTCPDQECHQGKEDLKKCVNEMKKELPKFLSKSTARWGVGILVLIMLAFSAAWGKTQYDVSNVKTDTAVQNERYGNILKALEELSKRQITLKDIHEAITSRIKHTPKNDDDDDGE